MIDKNRSLRSVFASVAVDWGDIVPWGHRGPGTEASKGFLMVPRLSLNATDCYTC